MRRRQLFGVSLLVALALVGCGEQRATEAVTEEAAIATHAAAENTPELHTFTLDVSGDSAVQMPPGEIAYYDVPQTGTGPDAIPAHRAVQLTYEDENRHYRLTLRFAADAEVGTYDISTHIFGVPRDAVAAEFVDMPANGDEDSADARVFNDELDGSMTLNRVGDTVSGHFEFTAGTQTTAEETEAILSIMAAGTFDDLDLSDNAGDATAEATDAPA